MHLCPHRKPTKVPTRQGICMAVVVCWGYSVARSANMDDMNRIIRLSTKLFDDIVTMKRFACL